MSSQIDRIRDFARTGASLLRSGAGALERLAGSSEDSQEGARFSRADAQADSRPKDLDDTTLARKVESIVFRNPNVPQGSIDVNAVGGVVYLRGEAPDPEVIRWLVAATEDIPEVERVENLLHVPGTPAPTRTDTPPAQRKEAGRRTRPRSEEVHVPPTSGVSEERPVEGAEPSPADLAADRRGRPASPMGSEDEAGPRERPER